MMTQSKTRMARAGFILLVAVMGLFGCYTATTPSTNVDSGRLGSDVGFSTRSSGGAPGGQGGASALIDARPNIAGGTTGGGEDATADAPMGTGGTGGTTTPSTCKSAAECSTGYCVDGICCESSCDGQCESCKEDGSVGKCKAIKGSPLSPRPLCGGTGACKGQCDGSEGKTCSFPDSTTVCAAATCANGKIMTASVCNSAGDCSTPTGSTCPNSQCAADGSAKCASSCTASSCGSGFYCDTTGACLQTLASGSSCSLGAQCSGVLRRWRLLRW